MEHLFRGLENLLTRKRQPAEHLTTDPNRLFVSAHKVLDHIWVGNEASSKDCKWLREHKIIAVVNATKHIPFTTCPDGQYPKYKYRVPVNDPGPGQPFEQEDIQIMFNSLDSVTQLIHWHKLRGENILIHCHAGAQRSAIIAAAYMAKYTLYPRAVIDYLDKNPHQPISAEQDLLMRRQSMLRALELVSTNRPPAFSGGVYANFRPALERWVS